MSGVLLVGLGIPMAIAVVLGVGGAVARARLRARYPAPGRLVDIGGHRLHLDCEGSGGPTVIFEGGLGAEAPLSWTLVRPAVADFARACVYDRAGYGWSDPGPRPRTAAVMVEELRSLLTAAEIPRPYVFVSHSIGGLVSRLFAATYPSEVAGMVLVDAAHEDQMERFPQEVVEAVDMRKMARMMGVMARVFATGVPALLYRRIPLQAEVPEPAAGMARALMASRTGVAALVAEQRVLEESQAQVRAAVRDLGDMPLVVLTHGRPAPLPRHAAITPEVKRRYEEAWKELQEELARTSRRGEFIVAEESGHAIQLDQPELVVDAIRRVVDATKASPAGP
jgi:pimeloyl-ACP methyl ester carboxylesterase